VEFAGASSPQIFNNSLEYCHALKILCVFFLVAAVRSSGGFCRVRFAR
jgi:hypothetical protein